MALENAQIIEKNIEKTVRIRCEYPYLNEAIRIAKNHQAEIIEQDLQLDCRLTVRIPLANAEACLAAWAQTRQIELLELGWVEIYLRKSSLHFKFWKCRLLFV